MITVAMLVAGAIVAPQDPYPPNVKIPLGWKVGYWTQTKTGKGALISPEGDEIGFPDYLPTGYVAAVISETDHESFGVNVVMDGRKVEVAIGSKGMLAVSYPPPGPFDYWVLSPSTRLAVRAIFITLTRLEVKGETRPSTKRERDSEIFPYTGLGVGWPTDYRPPNPKKLVPMQWTFRKGESVTHGGAMPESVKWTEQTTLLGRDLKVVEDSEGKLWASCRQHDKRTVVFSASKSTVRGAILAIFAAWAYVPD